MSLMFIRVLAGFLAGLITGVMIMRRVYHKRVKAELAGEWKESST